MPGRNHYGSIVRSTLKTVAINGAVVTALVGGGVSYVTFDNAVALSVDGTTETVHTFGGTVGDVLADQGIELGAHDEVVPDVESPVEDGSEISVRYGRQITVTVDGEETTVWTTALSVEEALDELGIRAQEAELSVARSLDIGRSGLAFAVQTPKSITVVADGAENPLVTTALTVEEALADAGVTVAEADRVEPALDAAVTDAATITVQRVVTKTETVTEEIEHGSTEKEDDELLEGKTEVVTKGRNGVLEKILRNIYVDGELESSEVVEENVVKEAVDEVVAVGTREPEPEKPSDDGGDIGDTSVWDRLAECESGGDWSINTGNGYYGGLQFSLGTWRAFGGSGYPHENSREEQIRIAIKVRDNRGGYGDWPACARKLGLPLG